MKLDPHHTALLVMDYQLGIPEMLPDKGATVIANTANVIAAARGKGIAVIYVVVGFRHGYPEVNPNNAGFAAVAKSGRMQGTSAADVLPEVAPAGNEPVVIKRRVGAFHGTDLEIILKAKQIDTLVMAGVSTSGVILSTVRHAADADYKIVILRDCCQDRDDEVHRVLMDKVFARHTVTTASELLADL